MGVCVDRNVVWMEKDWERLEEADDVGNIRDVDRGCGSVVGVVVVLAWLCRCVVGVGMEWERLGLSCRNRVLLKNFVRHQRPT